jgi:uncharacterized protein (TIGR03067 family)
VYQRFTVLILIAIPARADDKKPDAARLKGVWEVVSTTYDGKEVVAKGRSLVFTEKEFTAFVGDKRNRSVAFTLDPDSNPRRIDMDRGGKDGKALGIYSIDKDELKLCYAEPGAERPKEFESKAGKKVFLVILKRAKG